MANKPMILVVEDDAAVRSLIAVTLETRDYRYHLAQNGGEALIEATTHQPDVMLLDLGLPDMDGVEIIRKVRSWFCPAAVGICFVLRGVAGFVERRDFCVINFKFCRIKIRSACPVLREPKPEPETAFIRRDIVICCVSQFSVKIKFHTRRFCFISCMPVKTICMKCAVSLIAACRRLGFIVIFGLPGRAECMG